MAHRVFIDGEAGTTGLQIRQRMEGRSDVELLSIPEAERRNAAMREDRLNEADIAILCLPDDASREAVAMLAGSNRTRIIDTSTAHRVHPDWVYGFAELEAAQAERIRNARLVASPGCYPTGAIALLRPLRAAGIIADDYPVSVNAVSGYTGGGKQMIAQMEDASREDHLSAPHFLYGLDLAHKHLPEMREHGQLTRDPIFAPSVGRFPQGMLVQVPLVLDEGRSGDDRRQQALEPLAGLGQLGRDARRAGMDLGTDVMRDEPDDSFAIGGRQRLARIGQTFGQPVDPDAPVRVQHHFDHGRVFEQPGDGRAERRAQHSRAALARFRSVVCGGHLRPASSRGATRGPRNGVD